MKRTGTGRAAAALVLAAALALGGCGYGRPGAAAQRRQVLGVLAGMSQDAALSAVAWRREKARPRDPAWVAARLGSMAALIRRLWNGTAWATSYRSKWGAPAQRLFYRGFFGSAKGGREGVLPSTEGKVYAAFKAMLKSNPLLASKGWPVIPVFGAQADLDAYLICRAGRTRDRAWQDSRLLPRVHGYVLDGLSSRRGLDWLTSFTDPQALERLAAAWQGAQGPWGVQAQDLLQRAKALRQRFKLTPQVLDLPGARGKP